MSARFNGLYLKALLDFVGVWASEEVGSDVEVDFLVLFDDVTSGSFQFRQNFEYDHEWTEEVAYEKVMEYVGQQVIDGFPVWKYLKISAWTKAMLEVSFQRESEEALEAAKKKYPCFTCRKFEIERSSFGTRDVCKDEEKMKKLKAKNRGVRWNFSFEEVLKCSEWERSDAPGPSVTQTRLSFE